MEIRRGVTRTVLLARGYAIKLPSLRAYGDGFSGLLWSICRGILANQSEAQWWKHSSADQKNYMCPVLWSMAGIVNIYPRCEPFLPSPEQELAMFDRTWFPTPMSPRPGDNKPANYGILNGRVVCLDYDMNYNGCPHDRSGFLNRKAQDDDENA